MGTRRNPDFGVSLRLESDEDLKVLPKLTSEPAVGEEVTLMRLGDGENLLIARDGSEKKLTSTALGSSQPGCRDR